METPFRLTPATLDVLEVLLSGGDDLYGLKIAKAIGRASGSVVPILMRLEASGWVTSHWEETTEQSRGPRRRFYTIHPDHLAGARAVVASRRTKAKSAVPKLRPGRGAAGA